VNAFKKTNRKSFSESISQVGPYLGLGTQLAATVVLMVFVGVFLDNKFETKPIFILVCSLFGAFAGMYNFIKNINELDKKNKRIKNDKN